MAIDFLQDDRHYHAVTATDVYRPEIPENVRTTLNSIHHDQSGSNDDRLQGGFCNLRQECDKRGREELLNA